ncbi:putative ATP:guanido phosphotransferase YacI [Lachnospiraceae bacterium KM106-2]|nr:putative ATP:guanido phosphotransferase YacI [Lachnospiraceae bacterium KM106-2]
MLKWYEEQSDNQDIVLSSRIRLSRNLKKYPFSPKLTNEQAINLLEEVKESIKDYEGLNGKMLCCDLDKLSDVEKKGMIERHILSRNMLEKEQATGLIVSEDESLSILINEEDHLEIQSMAGGMNMKKAYQKANEMDDYGYDRLEFAYSEKFGYLTTCPTNVGTGLRASYLVFLPALQGALKINRLADEASKYGVSLRAVFGEGSNGVAHIFELTNQKTLGISENDVMNNLNNIVHQVMKQERKRREFLLSNNLDEIEDQVYRSYGILKYTTQINSSDAMTLLSQVKFGVDMKLLTLSEPFHFYELMMAILPYTIQCTNGKCVGSKIRDKLRAKFLNQAIPLIQS